MSNKAGRELGHVMFDFGNHGHGQDRRKSSSSEVGTKFSKNVALEYYDQSIVCRLLGINRRLLGIFADMFVNEFEVTQ